MWTNNRKVETGSASNQTFASLLDLEKKQKRFRFDIDSFLAAWTQRNLC